MNKKNVIAAAATAFIGIKLYKKFRHKGAVMKRLYNAVAGSTGVAITTGAGSLSGALDYLMAENDMELSTPISGLAIFMSEETER